MKWRTFEKPPRLKHAGKYDLQFGKARPCILAPADRAPRLEPFFARTERGLFGIRLGKARRHALYALGQGHTLGHDRLPPTIVDGAPIDDINPVGQVAVAKRLGQTGGLVERQSPARIDRQIEIRITSGPAGRP